MGSEIPVHIQHFIEEKIESIAMLEALLLLKSQPDQDWSAELLAQRLYIPASRTAVLLADLITRQLCAQTASDPPLYRYGPEPPETFTLLDELADLYGTDLIAITRLVHRQTQGFEPFSEAFRLNRDAGEA